MKVIILNGPMGVGKTTAGKYIAEKYAGTAFIDGDWCLDEWLEASLKSLPHFSSLENCIDTSGLKIDEAGDLIMRRIFEN